MGEAIIKGIMGKGLSSPAEIVVSDINRGRLNTLSQTYGITCTSDNREALKGTEVVTLAVKPQSLTELMRELKGYPHPQQLVLSIIAGATISTLTKGLEHETLVRVMPNTPAQIGEGMSVPF
jgi:pyrroline-5-carboxylate reductase